MASGNTNGIRGYNFSDGMLNVNGTIGAVAEIIDSGITGSVAAADFPLDGKYEVIDFMFTRFSPTSGGPNIHAQLSDDGGATFKTGATDYRYVCHTIASGTADNTFLSTNSNGDSKILIATNLVATGSQASRFTVRVTGHKLLRQPTSNNAVTLYSFGVKNTNAGGPPMGVVQSYGRINSAAFLLDAIRFEASAGNIDSPYIIIGYRFG